MTGPNPLHYGWWLASRASGLLAMALLTTAVLLGLSMGGRLLRGPGRMRVARALHEQLALAGLVAICVHAITLLGDSWLHPGVKGIIVPFAMGYRTVFTGLGILAGYLAALLGLSFYARRRIGVQRWRSLHRLTILGYAMALVHALGSGTDTTSSWGRSAMLVSAALVAAMLGARLAGARAKTARATRQPRPVLASSAHAAQPAVAVRRARRSPRSPVAVRAGEQASR